MRALAIILLFLLAPAARADDGRAHVPNPYGRPFDMAPARSPVKPPPWLELGGRFRMRSLTLSGLDLGYGALPSTGQPIWGARAAAGETVTGADMGLLLDPVLHVGPEVRIGMRLGLLENFSLGSTPASYPANAKVPLPTASSSQEAPLAGVNSTRDALTLHHLWMEWMSPVGLFVGGRMASDWGLGMVANSGSCEDCDLHQSVDRVGFVTSLFDHLWAVSYDFDASGAPGPAAHDLTDRDDVRTVSLAVSRYLLPDVARGRLLRGRTAFLWGLAASYRWQAEDLPGYYFTAPDRWQGRAEEAELVNRDMTAWLLDGWIRYWHPRFRLEAEAALMTSRLDNGSMAAGMDLGEATATQWGGVFRASFLVAPSLDLRLESGVASGDEAFGFGADPGAAWNPKPGDLDGAQADLAGDSQVNNFRFNPNYHVDEILWRHIVGTFTDGLYLRPELRWSPARWCRLDAAAVYSRALYAESAPGLARDLGVETILAANLTGVDGLFLRGAFAWLHPLDGFRNVVTDAAPTGAWSLRVLGGVRF